MTQKELLQLKDYLHKISAGEMTIDQLLSLILKELESMKNDVDVHVHHVENN